MRPELFSAMVATAVILLATSAIGAGAMQSDGSAGKIELEVQAGLVTLEARDAPLADVVRAIAERVGFEAILAGDLSMPVTASFTGLPVDDALERLLGDMDRAVVYAVSEATGTGRVILRLSLFAPRDLVEEPARADVAPAELDDLTHGDEETRARAALRLANPGASEIALKALATTLQDDEDAWVRSRAATALGLLRDERAVPALEAALADENAAVSMQAIQALGGIGGERATRALGDVLLYGKDRKQRIQAAWALGRQDTELAWRFLDAVADDPDQFVRMASETPPASVERSSKRWRQMPRAAGDGRRGSSSMR